MKTLFKPILFFIIIIAFACKKTEGTKPTDSVYLPTIPQVPVQETQAPVSATPVNNNGIINIAINKTLKYGSFITIDADNNGMNDLYFCSVLAMYNDVGHLYLMGSATSQSGSKILLKNDQEPWSLNMQWVNALDEGTMIQATPPVQDIFQNFMIKGAILDVPETTNIPQGTWVNKADKYMGFTVRIAGATHYGWVRMSHSKDDNKAILIADMAYNATPGEMIKAGQKSK
jgi:hypothetical protein